MINSHRLGLVFGGFLAIVHLVWVVLLAIGWAGPLLAFIYRIHSIDISFVLTGFGFGNAVMLLVFSFILGYLAGKIIGVLWNFISSETREDYVVDRGY